MLKLVSLLTVFACCFDRENTCKWDIWSLRLHQLQQHALPRYFWLSPPLIIFRVYPLERPRCVVHESLVDNLCWCSVFENPLCWCIFMKQLCWCTYQFRTLYLTPPLRAIFFKNKGGVKFSSFKSFLGKFSTTKKQGGVKRRGGSNRAF